MKTIREKIIERIVTQLKLIIVSNGYNNNIGLIPIFRQEPVVEKNSPSISIWELSETRERNSYGGTIRTLTIKIEVAIEVYENEHPMVISNELLGDIEKALIMANVTLDELIDDIQDIAAEIIQFPRAETLNNILAFDKKVVQPSVKNLAGASIDFKINYTTEWGDPYTIQ
ncbi:MAG: hypothetical protein KAH84_00360 [Thiomargarita sp.]|nr:hypothetical protein [Bacteroidales bacterium]MCK5718378.1 hypothetical protein [Thiomargarita sp.]